MNTAKELLYIQYMTNREYGVIGKQEKEMYSKYLSENKRFECFFLIGFCSFCLSLSTLFNIQPAD